VAEVLELEPLAAKWEAFRWAVREVDGHNVGELMQILTSLPFVPGRPSCVVAHTVKGKGISFMERQLLWHYRSPDAAELDRALRELDNPG